MGPLKGVKVLDLTSMVSGPMGAMMLADQGAEVIKVEPVNGELVRHMAAQHNGVNAPFFSCNRGKKSLAIDLKSEEGKEILLKLAAETDVFMQNFRPGAIQLADLEKRALIRKHVFMIQLFRRFLVLLIFRRIEIQAYQKCFVLLLLTKQLL